MGAPGMARPLTLTPGHPPVTTTAQVFRPVSGGANRTVIVENKSGAKAMTFGKPVPDFMPVEQDSFHANANGHGWEGGTDGLRFDRRARRAFHGRPPAIGKSG